MGVKLSQIINRREIDFKELENKKIAIDFSNAVYQFLASIRQRDGTPLTDKKGNITSHLMGILTRTTNLMSKNIKVYLSSILKFGLLIRRTVKLLDIFLIACVV